MRLWIFLAALWALGFAPAWADVNADLDAIAKAQVKIVNNPEVQKAATQQMGNAIKGMLDFSKVSDKDFDTLMTLFSKRVNGAITEPLILSFREKITAEFTPEEIRVLADCYTGKPCKVAEFSESSRAKAKELPKYGAEKGRQLGTEAGQKLLPEILQELQQGKLDDQFDDPKSILNVFTQGKAG